MLLKGQLVSRHRDVAAGTVKLDATFAVADLPARAFGSVYEHVHAFTRLADLDHERETNGRDELPGPRSEDTISDAMVKVPASDAITQDVAKTGTGR